MKFTDSQYDELMSRYHTNQIENRAIEHARKEEVYAVIPRIREIDKLLATSSIDAARAKLKGQADTTSATKEQNRHLIMEKEDLLKTHGYDVDYLKPIYTCCTCKDTGRVGNDFCPCFKQTSISLLYRQSTLERVLDMENFDTFDTSYYSKETNGEHPYSPFENMTNILNKVQSFVETFDKEGGNLLFYGETGLGKTFLSNCVAKALMDTQHTVLYQSSIHLFEDVLSDVLMKKNQNANSKEIYRYLYSCDLLIIDDLGTEFTNNFVASELYDILNTRLREGKSTIISTNLSLQELNERYSVRIASRIFGEYKVFHFYGNNIRLAKRKRALEQ
ncbi:MAG: ATP-binding protein [Lachnospiraceae bacterium]|nr:ATP-binding protein [Lachnospiraceae bacterium]